MVLTYLLYVSPLTSSSTVHIFFGCQCQCYHPKDTFPLGDLKNSTVAGCEQVKFMSRGTMCSELEIHLPNRKHVVSFNS